MRLARFQDKFKERKRLGQVITMIQSQSVGGGLGIFESWGCVAFTVLFIVSCLGPLYRLAPSSSQPS